MGHAQAHTAVLDADTVQAGLEHQTVISTVSHNLVDTAQLHDNHACGYKIYGSSRDMSRPNIAVTMRTRP